MKYMLVEMVTSSLVLFFLQGNGCGWITLSLTTPTGPKTNLEQAILEN